MMRSPTQAAPAPRLIAPLRAASQAASLHARLLAHLHRLWLVLPRGRSLAADVWSERHGVIVLLLWLHAVGLALFAWLGGASVGHSLLEAGVVAATAVLAAQRRLGTRLQAAVASVGLVTASAVLVHLSGAYIEAHFHFFVVVGIMALYQDWVPFLIAIGYVVAHHGLLGVVYPAAVYNHPAAWARPWLWAGIHGAFVVAASMVALIAWRLNEIMYARLRESNVKLEESNVKLEQQTAELRSKNADLDAFVYSVSHDLKSPLVAMHGMLALLVEEYGRRLDEQGRHYLGRIEANVDQMERLTRDLLTLARIGREDEGAQIVALDTIVDDELQVLAEPIARRGVKVVRGRLGNGWGIRTHLEEVFSNLISNAVKYLGDQPAPRLEIGAVDRGQWVECWVKDNGVGIDPAHHAQIFELFQRLNDVAAEGTGVGLSIVKKIVEGGGGRVWIESARGQGSTFRFTWPKTASAQAPPA